MKKPQWDSTLSMGSTVIDKQHKDIFQLIDDMYDRFNSPFPLIGEEFAVFLSKISDHGLQHFKDEEALMVKVGFPNFEQHKSVHKHYIYKVAMFNAEFLGENPTQAEKVLYFLINWWEYHIKTMDKEIEFHILNNSSKLDFDIV